MEYELSINQKAFDAIKEGEKEIEIRASTESNNYLPEKLKEGDTLIFFNKDSKKVLNVTVQAVRHYDDVRSLLETEGFERSVSRGKTIEEAIDNVFAIPGYREAIEKRGVYAIEVA